jgi:hypothetical protein
MIAVRVDMGLVYPGKGRTVGAGQANVWIETLAAEPGDYRHASNAESALKG